MKKMQNLVWRLLYHVGCVFRLAFVLATSVVGYISVVMYFGWAVLAAVVLIVATTSNQGFLVELASLVQEASTPEGAILWQIGLASIVAPLICHYTVRPVAITFRERLLPVILCGENE